MAMLGMLAVTPVGAQTPAPSLPENGTPAVAATAPATPAEAAPPLERGRVLYPANGTQPAAQTPARSNGDAPGLPGLATTFVTLLALCGAGYYLLRRQTGFAAVSKGPRKLVVSESRSLGNRQFLVVVEYESERVLLGVTPGKIDYLCPLPMGTINPEMAPKV